MCFEDCSGHCAQDRLSRRCSGSHVVAQARWPTTERGWGRELCKVHGSRALSRGRVNADAVSAKGERESGFPLGRLTGLDGCPTLR